MNTNELEDILQNCGPSFLGVFPSDQIPQVTLKTDPQCLVVNLDPSWKSGSHWVGLCLRNNAHKKICEIFDSYGTKPLIDKTLKNWKIMHNSTRFQKTGSRTCGEYCVFFVQQRLKGRSFKNIIQKLKAQSDPDDFVIRYVEQKKRLGGKGQCCQKAPSSVTKAMSLTVE